MKTLDEMFTEAERDLNEEFKRRMASGEDASEREAFLHKSQVESERLARNGCIEASTDGDSADEE